MGYYFPSRLAESEEAEPKATRRIEMTTVACLLALDETRRATTERLKGEASLFIAFLSSLTVGRSGRRKNKRYRKERMVHGWGKSDSTKVGGSLPICV